METNDAVLVVPQFTSMATSTLLLWFDLDWLTQLGNRFVDWIEGHLDTAIELRNRPSHVPGQTVLDVMRRRAMQQRIHRRKT